MVDIADELKSIYKNDLIPLTTSISEKEIEIFFPELNLTIRTDQIVDDSFSLDESICSESDLTLGSCEASQLKITVAGIDAELKDKEAVVTQIVNGQYIMPLGTFIVDSCIKQEDKWFKDITAYDGMKKTDVDVSTWYNNLQFPISVKDMKISLLEYLGLACEDQTLINDDVMLEKTIEPSKLIGRDILRRLCEINVGFGHFTRLNKFRVIQLNNGLALYPSETLFPAKDLIPNDSGELLSAGYKKINYEEYIVGSITKLQIHQEDGDVGVVVGYGDNTYFITGNFLLFGKGTVELEAIADKILNSIKNKFYRPHKTTMIGLPYLEVGDSISIVTSTDVIETYVFKRTLSGIQALEDEITAPGSQKRSEKVSMNTEVEQLLGKIALVKKTIEEVSVSVSQLDLQLTGEINVLAGQVVLKADHDGNIAAVELLSGPDKGSAITIGADNIALEGLVTVNGNFKILEDGTIEAVNGKFSGTIVSANMIGSTIYGGQFTSSYWNGNQYGSAFNEIEITGGSITCNRTLYTLPQYGGTTVTRGATLDYNGLDANNVYAKSVGSSGRYVTNSYLQNIYSNRIGNNSDYVDDAYLDNLYVSNIRHQSGGTWGLFGVTPTSRKSITKLQSSATQTDVINKVNELLTDLGNYNGGYGMFSVS